MKNLLLGLLLTTSVSLMAATAGPVRVGNGDDGEDLQSFSLITDGKILETRKKAVELLESFQIRKIKGLGALTPEVENTKLYMTKKGLTPKELAELGAYSEDGTGLVYARTFPVHYAATRFFPAAEKLDEKQLIALHIHEGLHRSLPEAIREDEVITTRITEAITSPDASRDKINIIVAGYLPKPSAKVAGTSSKAKIYVPKKSRLNNPSRFGLETRHYNEKKDEFNNSGIKSMYLISSHLYPFGEDEAALGLGFDASIVNTEDDSFMGPLSLSARYQVYTKRDFDIEAFAQLNLNTLSDEELRESRLGRDTTKIGVTFATRKKYFFIENDFSYTFESEVEEEINGQPFTHKFGGITGVNLRAGTHYKNFMLGGFTEILLADDYRLTDNDGEFDEGTGRNRLISWGPHLEYRHENYSVVLKGRFLLDATKEASYNYLSDLMGYGVGQGSLQTQFNVFF